MNNNHLDVRVYSQTYSPYRQKIVGSLSFEEVAALAATFLGEVESMLDNGLKDAYSQEAEYLWAAFPSRARNLEKYIEMTSVLLGQAIDFQWYAQHPRYQSDRDVKNDPTLYSFRRFNEDFDVKFRYVQYYGHILMRIPSALRLRYRRLINHPGKYTQGLTTTRCKKAMAGLMNQIAGDVARELGTAKPFPVLVNSVLRTVEYQNTLASLGYVAPRHSAHLAGYAVDIERLWYLENDKPAYKAIEGTLGRLFRGAAINLIEEATHWHVCLNPAHIPHYETLASQWEGN